MTPIDELAGGSTRAARPRTARGFIAVEPASLTDSVTVTLQNYSSVSGFDVPGGQWMPRGSLLPSRGDECLVVFDDEGDVWISAWAPGS